MTILNDKQIRQKVTRLAYEIIEQNTDQNEIILAGINNNGLAFAKLLYNELLSIANSGLQFQINRIKLKPANPLSSEITIDLDISKLKNKSVIVIDDVANTGRTLFFACKPFMEVLLNQLQVAVLIDRKHKAYPIKVDYVGLSLATTISEDISVNISNELNFQVKLN